MPQEKGASFIDRNRPPRVQIEYKVEEWGSPTKIQLPFVMGVMADLSAKAEGKKGLKEREFRTIDVDNFESFMASIKPRVSFRVDNKLTGEGKVAVDLTFESMDHFAPDSVASRAKCTSELFKLRTRLYELLTSMDGKDQAEQRIVELLNNPDYLKQLAAKVEEAEKAGSACAGGEAEKKEGVAKEAAGA